MASYERKYLRSSVFRIAHPDSFVKLHSNICHGDCRIALAFNNVQVCKHSLKIDQLLAVSTQCAENDILTKSGDLKYIDKHYHYQKGTGC